MAFGSGVLISAVACDLVESTLDLAGGKRAFVWAFGGGAILTMFADTMRPEAFKHGGPVFGLATMIGFTLEFLLASLA